MLKTCLKCGAESEVDDSALADCPKCGAIYARVEEAMKKAEAERIANAERDAKKAEAAERTEAKKRAQLAAHEQKQREHADLQRRAAEFAKQRRPVGTRRWFTPKFATLIFVVYCVVIVLPAFVMAAKGGALGVVYLIGALVSAGLGAVLLETILVLFHTSQTLEECRDYLRDIAERRPPQP